MRFLLSISILLIGFQSFSQGYATKILVAKDGSADYSSIQDAIDAAKAFPDESVSIFIAAGIYHEKVVVPSWNTKLKLIGDSTGQTIISFNDHFKKINRGRNSTFHTYTLKVEANDFYASNLIIRNESGPVGQAVSVHIEGDRVVFENCDFYGHQDTMYLAGEGARQYFVNCTIVGTTDFIFGNATVIFNGCDIHSLRGSYITAASTPKTQNFGFVFENCKLTASATVEPMSTYLGRPWRKYAKTVFINCEMGAHIRPEGWKEWNADGTAHYAEYGSKGEGARQAERVAWSKQLTKRQVKKYKLLEVFSGWDPSI